MKCDKECYNKEHPSCPLPNFCADLDTNGNVTIVDKEEIDRRMKEFQESIKPLQEEFAKDEAKRQEEIKNNPDNGKAGWWIVQGIRHTGYAHASSAQEAIDKCLKADVVQDWEMPTTRFWTVELPEAF